jgi:hypothetical protein
MLEIDTFTRGLEGKPLTTISWQGCPAWVARHVGALLGHAGGGDKLVHKVLGEWNAELQEGHDYLFLDGLPLQVLRGMGCEALVEGPPDDRDSLLLLLPPGLQLVLSKTHGPAEQKLRRLLVDEVLPTIARAEQRQMWRPEAELGVSEEDAQLWTMPTGPELSLVLQPTLEERREERAKTQARTQALWLEFSDRRFRVQALYRAIETLGSSLAPAARIAMEITAAEIATGLDIESLLDQPVPTVPRAA